MGGHYGRKHTRSPAMSTLFSSESALGATTAANTNTAFGDNDSIKIVYQTEGRVGEAVTDDHALLDAAISKSRQLNTNSSLQDTRSTNMSSIQGLSCHSRRSKVLVNLSTQNLLNNYQKKQKMQQIAANNSTKLPPVNSARKEKSHQSPDKL